MRVLGAAIFVAGCALTGLCVRASFDGSGGRRAVAGLLAPVGVLLAGTGALLLFVPDFFG
ncbi:MAG TPA: hypothetical protein VKE22_19990 [Haliangiales bacterium]|nr:hypothetical protein [Haliangiales bacterium]